MNRQEPGGMKKTRVLGLAAAVVAGVLLVVIGLHHGSRGGPAGAQLQAERLAARRLAESDPAAPTLAQQLPASVDRAYLFLNQMTDRYAQGPVPRLVQSYSGGPPGLRGDTSSHTYDDALVIDAYLAEGTPGGLARAKVVGNAMLFLQAHAVPHDGRLLNAYAPSPLAGPASVQVADPASSTGAMAWAGQALVQLYAATRNRSYLSGAIAIGNWIQSQDQDSRGAGGYTGGLTAAGTKISWKATEHNIDVYAFFRLLARETGNRTWSSRAAQARRFVVTMWDAGGHRFYLGTTNNGVTPNDTAQVEDVNSWSYLALQDPAYAASLNWAVTNLAVSAGGYAGVGICTGDRTGVWFEGTAQLADALETRDHPGDSAQAAAYLEDIAYAQAKGPDANGLGIMAASRDPLADCQGGDVYASLHTGTTAWYILAADGIDPLSGTPVSAQARARSSTAGR